MNTLLVRPMLDANDDNDNEYDGATSIMLSHEPLIHLKRSQLKCNVCVSQDELDGIYALTAWLTGYVANGGAGIPGQYELLMLYRRLRASHNAQQRNGS